MYHLEWDSQDPPLFPGLISDPTHENYLEKMLRRIVFDKSRY